MSTFLGEGLFKESGLSLRKFGAQHGVGFVSLAKWVRQSEAGAMEGSEIGFEEVKLTEFSEGRSWAAELSLPNGTILRVSREVPATMLDQLLRVC